MPLFSVWEISLTEKDEHGLSKYVLVTYVEDAPAAVRVLDQIESDARSRGTPIIDRPSKHHLTVSTEYRPDWSREFAANYIIRNSKGQRWLGSDEATARMADMAMGLNDLLKLLHAELDEDDTDPKPPPTALAA